jgi:polyphosphate kinase
MKPNYLRKKGASVAKSEKIDLDSKDSLINRELSWLTFARRVLALAEDPGRPLLERVKFAGIMGMLYDEFAMKRIGGLKKRINKKKLSHGGLTPPDELQMCQDELQKQSETVASLVNNELRPALAKAGIPILEHRGLNKEQRSHMQRYFRESVEPILTPLAVDVSHPFPFIRNLSLNLAVNIQEKNKKASRFVRIKVPSNRPRWVPLSKSPGYVPLEQVIEANLDVLFPTASRIECYFFRVTRGAKDDPWERTIMDEPVAEITPGSLLSMVTNELTGRKFAGVARVQVSADMPKKLRSWLAKQLEADTKDIEPTEGPLGLADLMKFQVDGYPALRDPPHAPVTHPRLRSLKPDNTANIFTEINRGDILLHHPYHNFDTSTLRLLQCAAVDPQVLAIKITIYRTSSQSPIIQTLVEAARQGKQVAVLVEITARFDEAPNIAWCKLLEQEGVHVAYGVERLKTHVKLALILREEEGRIRRYVHVGTGNYHTGTARLYEDLGILSSDPELGANVAAMFNELTGAIPSPEYSKLLVAPHNMHERFAELIRREIKHCKKGRPSGIRAKMNQLQDDRIIKELYRASQEGVPISLNVRGMCCLRAGVPGLSENIRVFSILGQFLEHGRIYRFENGGEPEFFIGSADWMRRNLDRRVESIMPVEDPHIKQELEEILLVYENDNCSAWDMQPDGNYSLRHPLEGEEPRPAQKVFIDLVNSRTSDFARV